MRKSKIADSELDIEWIPILFIKKPCKKMGITANGWCVETPNGVRVLDNLKSYMYCIAIIETPYNELALSLEEVFGNNLDICDIFPFLEIVEHIFNYFISDYWISLAISWVKVLNIDKRRIFSNSLEKIITAKTISQEIRHQAKRMVHEMEGSF